MSIRRLTDSRGKPKQPEWIINFDTLTIMQWFSTFLDPRTPLQLLACLRTPRPLPSILEKGVQGCHPRKFCENQYSFVCILVHFCAIFCLSSFTCFPAIFVEFLNISQSGKCEKPKGISCILLWRRTAIYTAARVTMQIPVGLKTCTYRTASCGLWAKPGRCCSITLSRSEWKQNKWIWSEYAFVFSCH